MKVFPSKVSYPLLGLVVFLFIYPIFILGSFVDYAEIESLLFILFMLLVLGFVLSLFLGTTYTIIDETLLIKSGFIRFPSVAIQSIKKIKKSSSIISSPAASFDRIEIFYGKFDTVIISPKDQHGFIAALQDINPTIISTVSKE